jgi:hypothetical protein
VLVIGALVGAVVSFALKQFLVSHFAWAADLDSMRFAPWSDSTPSRVKTVLNLLVGLPCLLLGVYLAHLVATRLPRTPR